MIWLMMTKEKFLFELVDNYLYPTVLGCMVMENYLLKDRTPDYIACANSLGDCLDFYEQLRSQLNETEYSEQEVDAILTCLIQSLKQDTLTSIDKQLRKCVRNYLPDSDQFFDKYLMYDKYGRPQELTASVLLCFIKRLRELEAAYAEKK